MIFIYKWKKRKICLPSLNIFYRESFVFQLKLNTAPVFMHFPAKGKHKKGDTMDIHRFV